MEELKLNVTPNGDTLTVLYGNALEQKQPNTIKFEGDIKTVSNFLKVRRSKGAGYQSIDVAKAVIIVDKFNRTIELFTDPENTFGASIKGKLELSNELKAFSINELRKFTRTELVAIIKMNRIYFENREKHLEILTAFQKIESTVNYSAKDGSDDRGNKERQFVKNVTTNAPMSFTLRLPIFKGFEAQSLSVEVCLDIEEGTAKFWLESVQLNELLQTCVEEIFNNELNEAKDFVIINK